MAVYFFSESLGQPTHLILLWAMTAIKETNFTFKGQTGFYRGKVRDVYYFGDRMVMVASDRISAFDVVLPRAIPDKGRVLN